MADYPYVTTPDALKRFLAQIPTSGVPTPQLTIKDLEARGFKSHNHRAIIPILRFIGFLDADNKPTGKYLGFRDRESGPAVMAAAIKSGYADLFSTYPDAYNKDTEALRNFFSTHSAGGQRVQDSIVGTFKTLCAAADFTTEAPEETAEAPPPSPGRGRTPQPPGPTTPGLVVNLNIQLALPVTENAEVYDKIFASLKKNLM